MVLAVSEHGKAQPLLCTTPCSGHSHHLHSPTNQHCPGTRLSCSGSGADGTDSTNLVKASRAQWEWQNHAFTWWCLLLNHTCRAVLSSCVPQAAQLLSPPLTFSKSLHLSSPPLKTWEMSFARPMADGIRSLRRGRAPPLPEHVPKRKPLLLGLISPSQP